MVQVSQILLRTAVPPLSLVCASLSRPCGEALSVHRESNRLSRYPGPTLKALDLVQQEQFRKDILRPDLVEKLTNTWMTAFMPPKE
jgi:hypothetical protein